MYHRNRLIVIIVISIVIHSCSSSTKSTIDHGSRSVDNAVFLHSIYDSSKTPYLSIYSDNANFRLDFNGQLRSLKASYGQSIDSFLYVNLKTAFGKSVASFVAFDTVVVFEDYQIGKVYFIDYPALSNYLNVPINFTYLQNIFAASYNLQKNHVDFINSDSLNNEISVYKVVQKFNDTIEKREIFRFNPNPLYIKTWEIHTQNSDVSLNTDYDWNDKFCYFHPKFLGVSFSYADYPIEIEFEFKSIFQDSLVSFSLDTTLIPEAIRFTE